MTVGDGRSWYSSTVLLVRDVGDRTRRFVPVVGIMLRGHKSETELWFRVFRPRKRETVVREY